MARRQTGKRSAARRRALLTLVERERCQEREARARRCSPQMDSSASVWRRRDEPRHVDALTIHARSRNIGDEIPVLSDRSIDRGTSLAAADFMRRHLEGSALRVNGSRGMSQRLHVIPGNHAVEVAVRCQHDVPVKCGAARLRRRVEDVDPSWRQLLHCRCQSGRRWWRGLRSASCATNYQSADGYRSEQPHLHRPPLLPGLATAKSPFLQSGRCSAEVGLMCGAQWAWLPWQACRRSPSGRNYLTRFSSRVEVKVSAPPVMVRTNAKLSLLIVTTPFWSVPSKFG